MSMPSVVGDGLASDAHLQGVRGGFIGQGYFAGLAVEGVTRPPEAEDKIRGGRERSSSGAHLVRVRKGVGFRVRVRLRLTGRGRVRGRDEVRVGLFTS